MKKNKKYWCFVGVYALVILALNLAFRFSMVCDWYTDHIFGIWQNTYGVLTGIFPFSVGEVLITLAIGILLFAVLLVVLLLFSWKKQAYVDWVCRYLRGVLIFVLTVGLVMTLNCTALYGCSKLVIHGDREYGETELRILRNYVVEKCNTLCEQVERDAEGNVACPEKVDRKIPRAVEKLAEENPRFSGYVPRAKKMWGSYFMYQTGMTGVYFPFSLEANYNGYISDMYYPAIACHELAHLKGYIYEDEANYWAYRACVGSEDPMIQYSGYMQMLWYLDSDYLASVDVETYMQQPEILEQVYQDDSTYTEEVYEELNSMEPVISDEVMETVGDTVDNYYDFYGAEQNYAEVTKLLLQYYDGILY